MGIEMIKKKLILIFSSAFTIRYEGVFQNM